MSAHTDEISLEVVTPATLPDLTRFFRAMAAEEHPDDPEAPGRAEAGLNASLTATDLLQADKSSAQARLCWLILARVGGDPAAYALAVRIPKTDRRKGFLFVDEVHVRRSYRRRGLGRALMERIQTLAGQLDLAGVRLLVRRENQAGRALYRDCGFQEFETMFCQWLVPSTHRGSETDH